MKNSLFLNYESFNSHDSQLFDDNFKEFIDLLKQVEKIDYNKICYDTRFKEGIVLNNKKNIFENNDLKRLYLSILTKLHPLDDDRDNFEYTIQDILVINNLFNYLIEPTNTLISISGATNFQNNQIEIKCNGNIFSVSNIFNTKSLKACYNKKVPHILKQAIDDSREFINAGLNTGDYSKIFFHDEFRKDFNKIQNIMQDEFIGIMKSFLLGEKLFTDYNYSDESTTVKNTKKYKSDRLVKFKGVEKFISLHIKLKSGFRLYIKFENNCIYLGKYTKHLKTAKFK